MAQEIVPTTPSNFLNYLLGVVAAFLGTIILPLAYLWGQGLIAERKLKNAQLADQLRATIDSAAQKAIGGAMGNIDLPDGKLAPIIKRGIVNDAAKALAKNFPETLTALGVEQEHQMAKAREVVESRLGLMDAQANGNPVPNPSQPIPVTPPATQNVTVTPPKK